MKKTTRSIIRIALLLGAVVSLFFVPWLLVKAWILPLPDTVQEQLNQGIELGFSGMIVYVDRAGNGTEQYAAGWHDRENKIPAKPDALFKIASISKLYVAVTIAKLAARGTISIDDKLSRHFPELEGEIEYADRITIKMLVEHRSGIPNYTDTENYWASPEETYQGKLNLVLGLPANFKPGENYEYSNTNYLLLRELMDRALGYNYFEFVKVEILDPLELKNTYQYLDDVDTNLVMSGYHEGYPHDLKYDNVGMISTAEDLAKFIRALNEGKLFNNNEEEIYSSIYKFGHTGLVPGYQSIARYHPDIDAVVIQFSGPTSIKGYNWNLSNIIYSRILDILRNNVSDFDQSSSKV
ncbi:serine hydrolase domain-containing protein [Halocola ammonii]